MNVDTIWPLKIYSLMNIINSEQTGVSRLTIPSETSRRKSFLELHLEHLLAFFGIYLHPLKDILLLMENWCGSDMRCLIFSLFWRCVIRDIR